MKTHPLSYLLGIGFVLILCACAPAAAPQPTAAPTPEPSPTPLPPRQLTICLGQEPSTLYFNASSSRAMWAVLEAVYDGPIDLRAYQPVPVILEELPSLENGKARLTPVAVKNGDLVVDASGALIALKKGSQVRPAGCQTADCLITWDGQSPLEMDALSAEFTLKSGINWSDGQPVTAQDSLFAYQIASDPATPIYKDVIDQTDTYEALDDRTVRWTGLPGYFPQNFNQLFWHPLPAHQLQGKSAADLLTDPAVTEKPLGWGPYLLEEWVKGQYIRLVKNPAYYRASEGLPKFDILVFRFSGSTADGNLAALENGQCDVVDQTTYLEEDLQTIRQMELDGKIKTLSALGPEWEHLDFGIKPQEYDNGYNPFASERPDYFGDARVRQAFAYCMDREGAIKNILKTKTAVPASYLPPQHPLFAADLSPLPFDPEKGKELLEAAGWKDFDNDPATPRTAANVKNVPAGTPFVVEYAYLDSPIRQQIAAAFQASLAECGIQMNPVAMTLAELSAPAPDGKIFGRKFDLVQFAWSAGLQPPCFLYESDEIATQANGWVGRRFGGVNITGYENPDFDAACQQARQAGIDGEGYRQAHLQAQAILARDLPSIPLYYGFRLMAARPEVCGLEVDISARSEFANLETLDLGPDCLP